MSIAKRIKDWFFTPTGSTPNEGVRFLRFNTPEEETYRNLFATVPAFLETEDRAKTDSQGLVHKATDAEAKGYDETELTTKTKAVIPSQLPELKETSDTIAEIKATNIPAFTGNTVEVNIASNSGEDTNFSKRNVFRLSLKDVFLTWLRNSLLYLSNSIDTLTTASSSNTTNINTYVNPLAGGTANQELNKVDGTNGNYVWQNKVYKMIIKVNTTNQIDYLVFDFNANITVSFNNGATINTPVFPLTYTSGTVVTLDTTGVNKVLLLTITRTN
jgi:hypothetical protein